MTDRSALTTEADGADRKIWSSPTLRAIAPARRTRGGSGEQNGDVDDIIYDLS